MGYNCIPTQLTLRDSDITLLIDQEHTNNVMNRHH